jgi:DNA-binding NtrC family response regulator
MINNYVKYLESTTELQALYIRRLTTLIILDITNKNSVEGIKLGETWLNRNKAEIMTEIIGHGGIEIAVEELKRKANMDIIVKTGA